MTDTRAKLIASKEKKREPECFHCGRAKEEHRQNDQHCVGYLADRGEDTNAEMIRRLMGARKS